MILTLILNIGYFLIQGALNLLPYGHLDAAYIDSIATLSYYISIFNDYFPVQALFNVFSAWLAFETVILIWRMWMYLYSKTPVVGK